MAVPVKNTHAAVGLVYASLYKKPSEIWGKRETASAVGGEMTNQQLGLTKHRDRAGRTGKAGSSEDG
jgi:hypothetical protein